MKILHIDLKLVGKDNAELCYVWDNQNQQSRQFPLAQIAGLIDRAERDYYTRLPEEYTKTGQAFYNWLDGSDRLLADALNQNHHEGLILAISTDKGLAHLPWELLHDGESFLVEKMPPIIPLRWMKKQQKTIKIIDSPQNRPLNLLFMATSPLGVEPVLDYEAEEGQILEATKRIPLNLRVEESGCLKELGSLVQEYDKDYFDVFHLTGHATHKDQKPCFLTEDEYGNCVYSNSRDIANTFKKLPLPSLIFLSGCRTGYASHDDIPSMAEELLNMGAKAVLGWGGKVLDIDASTVSSTIYGELSAGKTITQALALTYEALINKSARDWHKLRLYVGPTLPQALVTTLRTKGRKQLPKPTISLEFKDNEGHLRVVSPENFVGRRRQLQNCLRNLAGDSDKVGVLIHGMGGLGKSSIASRLWDRLPEHETVLWWQQIDESKLIEKLSSKLMIKPELQEVRTVLEAMDGNLEVKLTYLFSQLVELREKSFLFIFDDFELNLDPRDGGYILQPEVVRILKALVRSIQQKGTKNKIIITCRYRFDSELLDYFYEQGLESLKKAELTKKLSRLEHFSSQKIPEDLRERALTLAAGNPRLLEFLNDEVLGEKDAQAKLIKLEQSPEMWKDKIIWKDLYQEIDEPLQQILSYFLIYEIPVPMEALEAVCESLPNYKQQLQRGLELGLIEPNPQKEYQVSRILPHIISTIKLPQDEKNLSKLSGKAVQKLSQLWGKKENENLEKWQEIFRLAFADKENQDRFREQFSKVIEVQYNHGEADDAYQIELKKVVDEAYQIELKKIVNELSQEHLYNKLKEYLIQKNWKKADEETAFIFYLLMVMNKYKDFYELFKNISLDIINEIDRIWMLYSDDKLGIKGQSQIYQNLGGNNVYNKEILKCFGDQVGWREAENWLSYQNLDWNWDTTSIPFHLPYLLYRRDGLIYCQWGQMSKSVGNLMSTIFSRIRE